MKKDDFRQAFGTPDAAFTSKVETTLRKLRAEEEKPVKKFRISIAVAVAACLLLAAVGFATVNHWGIFDFINRYNVKMLPEAVDIVATDIPQEGGETELAQFSLREAIYDGQHIYMIVDVKPQEGILLLGVDSSPEDSMSDLLDKDSNLSIEAYAEENNLTMMRASMGSNFIESMDFHLEEDGTLVYELEGAPETLGAETFEGVLTTRLTPIIATENPEDATSTAYTIDHENPQTSELSFSLTLPKTYANIVSVQNAEYPSCGAKIDSVEFTASPLGLYYQIIFSVSDEDAYEATDGGLWFEFIDENGERVEDGASTGGSINEIEDGKFVQIGAIGAAEELPTSITLRGFNCWTKDRYETCELAVSPNP